MLDLSRRGFLIGLGAALAAPAIIRTPGLLMPVKPFARTQVAVTSVYSIAADREYLSAVLDPGQDYVLPPPMPNMPNGAQILKVFNAAYHRDPTSRLRIEEKVMGSTYVRTVGHSATYESRGDHWQPVWHNDSPGRQMGNHGFHLRSA